MRLGIAPALDLERAYQRVVGRAAMHNKVRALAMVDGYGSGLVAVLAQVRVSALIAGSRGIL